jgi:hypothetical protein
MEFRENYYFEPACGTKFLLGAQPLSHGTQGWLISPKTPMHATRFLPSSSTYELLLFFPLAACGVLSIF